MNIGITGNRGLVGWHLSSFLKGKTDVAVLGADAESFSNEQRLVDFASKCDAIVHLAGKNRGDPSEVSETNIRLTDQLISACKKSGRTPHVLFASSVQIFRDTPYGKSKKICSDRLASWAQNAGAMFTNLILPNIFGEGGKPFYNSVVSTFCYQLATGGEPKIIDDSETEQLHAQQASQEIFDLLKAKKGGEARFIGQKITVSALLAKLKALSDSYRGNIIPNVTGKFDLQLFNTYRSYLYPDKYPIHADLRTDARGALFEAVKSLNAGQVFISTTKPGITRGNHYHTEKIERFLVLRGQADIRIRKLFGNEIKVFQVNSDAPGWIDIPTLHTHNITNTGTGELVTLFWSHEIFDPNSPDTFSEAV